MQGRFLTLPFVLAIASCSSSGGDDGGKPSSTSSQGTTVTCETEPRDVYVANLEKPGAQGAFRFVLVESQPAPPSRGRNSWTLKVVDAGGSPVVSGNVAVNAFMPSHGHASPTVPTITPSGDAYEIGPISLFMPGLWEVTVDADAAGKRDSAVFRFCVAG